jgi:hypothetical protein
MARVPVHFVCFGGRMDGLDSGPESYAGLSLFSLSLAGWEACFTHHVPWYVREGHPRERIALRRGFGCGAVWRQACLSRRLGGEGVGAAVKWRFVASASDSSLTQLESALRCHPACRWHRWSAGRIIAWFASFRRRRPTGLRIGVGLSVCSLHLTRLGVSNPDGLDRLAGSRAR